MVHCQSPMPKNRIPTTDGGHPTVELCDTQHPGSQRALAETFNPLFLSHSSAHLVSLLWPASLSVFSDDVLIHYLRALLISCLGKLLITTQPLNSWPYNCCTTVPSSP